MRLAKKYKKARRYLLSEEKYLHNVYTRHAYKFLIREWLSELKQLKKSGLLEELMEECKNLGIASFRAHAIEKANKAEKTAYWKDAIQEHIDFEMNQNRTFDVLFRGI